MLKSVTKGTSERYLLRFEPNGWANIVIDDRGFFDCQSDWGDYCHVWAHHGRSSFKAFLMELDASYFLLKTSKRDTFYYEESVKEHKQAVLRARKDGNIMKGEAREFYDLHFEYSQSADLFAKEIVDNHQLFEKIYGDYDWLPVKKDYSPQALHFAKEVLPLFQEVLRKELADAGS